MGDPASYHLLKAFPEFRQAACRQTQLPALGNSLRATWKAALCSVIGTYPVLTFLYLLTRRTAR